MAFVNYGLHYAVRTNDVESVRSFLNIIPHMCNVRNMDMQTPLDIAIKNDDLIIIELLIQFDATQITNKTNYQSLFGAVRRGSIPVVALLFKLVPECITYENENGDSILCCVQDVDMLQFLLRMDHRLIDKCNVRGQTVLYYFVIWKKPIALIRILLSAKPSLVFAKNQVPGGRSLWDLLSGYFYQYEDVIRTIVACCPDLNFVHENRTTILHLAVYVHCDVTLVAEVYKYNPQYATIIDHIGKTPFCRALIHKDLDVQHFFERMLPFGFITAKYKRYHMSIEPLRKRVEEQCSTNLLLPELWNNVMEYLGFQPSQNFFFERK